MMSLTRSHVLLTVALAAGLAAATPALAGEIHQAITAGDQSRVAQLLLADPALASEADTNVNRDLPLHVAAAAGQVGIARLLLEAGADINGGDVDESTPLDVAALRGQREMMTFLIARGADINHRDRRGSCPLSFAAFGGDSVITRLVLDAGADLNYRSENGTTLLHAAALRGQDWLLDLLLEHGQDLNVTTDSGETVLHWAARGGRVEMTERLLAAGVGVDQPDTSGRTPLHAAMQSADLEVTAALLEHGADPNHADRGGVRPIILACWSRIPELAALLVLHGADVNRLGQDDKTPLWWAVDRGDAAMAGVFLDAGAQTTCADAKDRRTPLHLAALCGYRDIADRLLAAGASMADRDAAGNSPLQLALRYGNDGVAQVLRDHGARAEDAVSHHGLAAPGELAEQEAKVWYLGHSGWAVQTTHHFLVFDYPDLGRPADEPGLVNGHIAPREVAGQKVTVFTSHEHGDHMNPVILGWRDEIPDLTYVFGFRPEDSQRPGLPEQFPAYEFIGPRETRDYDGVKVTAIESNDSGAGFLVEVDGVTILHPGDHANRQRDFSGPYKPEIEFLAATGKQPDIAFFPISGCGFGDLEAVKLGTYYALETLAPKVFLPMHGGTQGWRYREFNEACGDRFPRTQLEAMENKGDCFHYKDGRAS